VETSPEVFLFEWAPSWRFTAKLEATLTCSNALALELDEKSSPLIAVLDY
jgi:hypothetical protein